MAQSLRVRGSSPCRLCTRTPPLWAQGRAWWLSGLVPALSVPPSRVEGNFLRSLASLTGGRYHCLVGEDLLSHLHRLLGSLLRERVGCGTTERLCVLADMAAPPNWEDARFPCQRLCLPAALLSGRPSSRLAEKQRLRCYLMTQQFALLSTY